MPSDFPLNYVSNSRIAHTEQNNLGWVPFCMQRGMPMRHFPVYLKKESLSLSSTILFPSTELPGVSGGSSYRQESVSHIRAEEVGSNVDLQESTSPAPFLLTPSPGSIPSYRTSRKAHGFILSSPSAATCLVMVTWKGKGPRSAQKLLQISDC